MKAFYFQEQGRPIEVEAKEGKAQGTLDIYLGDKLAVSACPVSDDGKAGTCKLAIDPAKAEAEAKAKAEAEATAKK